MAYDLQAPFPIRLPKRITPDETPEDYDTSITQNEDGVNQNFSAHHNALQDLQERVRALEEG